MFAWKAQQSSVLTHTEGKVCMWVQGARLKCTSVNGISPLTGTLQSLSLSLYSPPSKLALYKIWLAPKGVPLAMHRVHSLTLGHSWLL